MLLNYLLKLQLHTQSYSFIFISYLSLCYHLLSQHVIIVWVDWHEICEPDRREILMTELGLRDMF